MILNFALGAALLLQLVTGAVGRIDHYIVNLQHAHPTRARTAELRMYVARRALYRMYIHGLSPYHQAQAPASDALIHVAYQASPDIMPEGVYAPADPGRNRPVFVVIPGGPLPQGVSWTADLAPLLAHGGAVAFEAQYRSDRQYGGGSPQTFQDVACDIEAARALAPRFGGDPTSVTLVAHSFGGFVANEEIFGGFGLGRCNYRAGDYHPDEYVSLDAISASDEVMPTFIASDFPDALDIRSTLRTTNRRLPILVVQGSSDIVARLAQFSPTYYADLVADGFSATYYNAVGLDHSGVLGDSGVVNAILGR